MPRVLITASLFVLALASASGGSQARPPALRSPRLYVFDCGTLDVADLGRFRLTREEVVTDKLSVGCYLVEHPRGTLMWDTGAVPDMMVAREGPPATYRLQLPNGQERNVAIAKPLSAQMAEAGFAADRITHLALSHYHYDHTANTNDFSRATWLVRQVERDAMFAARPPDLTQPGTYNALTRNKTTIIKRADHDVFGDGSVVIKFAPGHTPGHQVLYVKLARTGGVVLTGDLYHYPEERTLNRIPTFDDDQAQTAASRASLETFLKRSGAQLWIQHDYTATAKLKKSPQYYD